MNVLIIEPAATGHHANYLRWIVSGLIERGHQLVIATSPASLNHPLVSQLKSSYPSIRWLSIPLKRLERDGVLPLIKRELGYWVSFGRCYKDAKKIANIDHVMLPYLDYCAYAFSAFGAPFEQTPWTGILMRPGFHYKAMGVTSKVYPIDLVKRQLIERLLKRSGCRLFSIDESLTSFIHQRYPQYRDRFKYLPDPVDAKKQAEKSPAARQRHEIPQACLLVLVYGAISARKGLDRLLRMAASEATPQSVHILVAGMQDEGARRSLQGANATHLRGQKRLHEWNRHIDESEEAEAFGLADVTWLAYRNHLGMSGVLVLSAFHKVPVIVGSQGLMKWLVDRHELGWSLSDSSPLKEENLEFLTRASLPLWQTFANNNEIFARKFKIEMSVATLMDGL